MDPHPVSLVFGVAILFCGLLLYGVPTIIAYNRDHHNQIAIFVLNLLLGWTFLGWVIALVWACSATSPSLPHVSTPITTAMAVPTPQTIDYY